MSEPSSTITISHAIKAQLEALSVSREESTQALAEEAIAQFLELRDWKQMEIHAALQELKTESRFISGAAMSEWVASWDTQNEQPAPKADVTYSPQCK